MNLDVSSWKEFRVGNLFDIHPTKAVSGVSADDCVDHGYPLVVNSAGNNGVVGLCDIEYTEKGNVITFSDTTDGNTFFYQPGPFIGFAHVQGMYPKDKKITKYVMLFISTILMFDSMGRYNYGRKMRRDTISEIMLKLPCQYGLNGSILIDSTCKFSNNGYVPDWRFMENYIKSLRYKSLTTKNKIERAPELKIDEWEEFTVPELFGEVIIAKSADIGNLEEGSTPFIGRTDINNGIQGFVSPVSVTKGRCITISMVGTNVALYQENDFQASQNIAVLRRDDISKETALFICSMINFEMRLKYSYGRTVGKTNIEQMILKLPVDSNSNPDWQFMEDYIKSLPYGDRLDG